MIFVMPNLRHLRVFLEVARQRSISRAAPQVFLSQPAITQAIGKLESLLGTKLFERQSSGMFTTQAGEALRARVIRCIHHLERGLRVALRGHYASASADNFLPQLTTTQLRALIAVTDNHSFRLASRQLELSQSSLHRVSRELEQLLGITLFEKTSASILPTRAAGQLARAAKLAFGEIEQGYYEISAMQSREVGKIVIGSMPLARTAILPEAINRFGLTHPNIAIEVVDAPYSSLLLRLRNGDLDLLVGALRYPPPTDDIVQEKLIEPSLAIVARNGHPLLHSLSVQLDSLLDYGWVLPSKGTPTRAFFDTLFTEHNLPAPKRLVETSSQTLIRELLCGSDRLTLLSTHQVHQELAQNILSVIPYDLNHTKRHIGITVRHNWHPTPTQKDFLDFLHQAASPYLYEST